MKKVNMRKITIQYQSGWVFTDTCWMHIAVKDGRGRYVYSKTSEEFPKGEMENPEKISAALLIEYLHQNPKTHVELDQDGGNGKETLHTIVEAHNYNILLKAKRKPKERGLGVLVCESIVKKR